MIIHGILLLERTTFCRFSRLGYHRARHNTLSRDTEKAGESVADEAGARTDQEDGGTEGLEVENTARTRFGHIEHDRDSRVPAVDGTPQPIEGLHQYLFLIFLNRTSGATKSTNDDPRPFEDGEPENASIHPQQRCDCLML